MKKLGLISFIFVLSIISTISCASDKVVNEEQDIVAEKASQDNNEEVEEESADIIADVKFYTLDGEEVSFHDFLGKPMVINVWASWCPPCKAEMPSIEESYKIYGEDVNYLIIDMLDGVKETEEKAKSYIEENDYTMPFYLDTDREVASYFRVMSIPATYFVNKDGTFFNYQIGMIEEEQLDENLKQLILYNSEDGNFN